MAASDNVTLAEAGIPWPSRKLETWRYSPLKKELMDLPLAREIQSFDEDVILISAGQLAGEPKLPDGVRVEQIPLPVLAKQSSSFVVRHPMATLNSTEMTEQLTLTIDKNTELAQPIEIVYLDAPATRVNTRVEINVGDNAKAIVIERNVSKDNFTNSVTQFHLKPGAKVYHHNLICHGNQHVHALLVAQENNSRFEHFALATTKGFARLDLDVDLQGEGATCQSHGAYLLTNKAHFDFHAHVVHNASHTQSDVNFRGLIDNQATGVFHSTAIATKDKKQIEAHQHNHNLLMSTGAKINTQPVLEIDTDDIACSHGATIGQIDENVVFYCQSRGIGESKARAMLTQSFLAGQSECIADVALKKRVKCALCDAMKAHFGDDHDCGL